MTAPTGSHVLPATGLKMRRGSGARRAAGCEMHTPTVFDSFFMAGFECSTHRRRDGRRLDLIAGTRHDRWGANDYRAVAAHACAPCAMGCAGI